MSKCRAAILLDLLALQLWKNNPLENIETWHLEALGDGKQQDVSAQLTAQSGSISMSGGVNCL